MDRAHRPWVSPTCADASIIRSVNQRFCAILSDCMTKRSRDFRDPELNGKKERRVSRHLLLTSRDRLWLVPFFCDALRREPDTQHETDALRLAAIERPSLLAG
jgi:hypothetical protein